MTASFVRVLTLLALASRATSLSFGLSSRVVRSRRASTPAMLADDSWSSLESQIRSQLRSVCAGVSLGEAKPLLSNKPKAWVLIFNEGSANEGVYTLQGRSTRATSYVLAFEEHEEASRFGLLLQAQGFDEPAAVQWPSKHLSEFCEGAGFELGLVPHDTVLLPPSNNFYDNDAFSRLERSDAEQPLAAERAALERLLGLPDTGMDA